MQPLAMQPLVIKVLLIAGLVFALFDVVLIFACLKINSRYDENLEYEIKEFREQQGIIEED